MKLDLTDEETAALARLLSETIDADRYPLSPRIQLLKAILGIAPIVSGSVTVFGRPASDMRWDMAYVPQREVVDWDFPVVYGTIHRALLRRYPFAVFFRIRPKKRALAHRGQFAPGTDQSAGLCILKISG